MSSIVILLSIVGTVLVGAVSPGPSFVLVSHTAIIRSRQAGLAAALGMGIGGAVFALLALAGLNALLMRVEWAYLLFKLLGGAYLAYLGVRIWRGASLPLPPERGEGKKRGEGAWRSFFLGAATQLSNPKTALVYGSIFAAFLPASPEAWLFTALPLAVFLIEAGWYAVVALVFSAERPRAAYGRAKHVVDRIAGAVLVGLGIRLILDAVRLRPV
ncbi:LysE family transporter [Rhizobium sp. S-51]|uniref:LysE family transporter n=1 Tax=Rhizobium terricola TaxID=2728849 RepID=A0A7Y0FWT4_9HYPH|nr:LysE family transporter [Rhizobium terricola]NML75240.1 LysE family transporter [Rhizobium terricola]